MTFIKYQIKTGRGGAEPKRERIYRRFLHSKSREHKLCYIMILPPT